MSTRIKLCSRHQGPVVLSRQECQGACAGLNVDRRHGVAGGGEGFCDVGMARVFLFCELGGEVMSTTQLYSCRHVLGLQAQSFVGQ